MNYFGSKYHSRQITMRLQKSTVLSLSISLSASLRTCLRLEGQVAREIDSVGSHRLSPSNRKQVLRIFSVILLFFLSGWGTSHGEDSSHLLKGKQASFLIHALNDAFIQVYKKLSPSVVIVEIRSPSAFSPSSNIFSSPFFSAPGSSFGGSAGIITQGSGFFISDDGLILTNYHLIRGAERGGIFVKLQDECRFSAQLIGSDEHTDIAVLKIKSAGLSAVEFADSDKVRIGQFAFALGAPYDLPYTFTFGVVSGLNRSNLTDITSYESYIQTDVDLHPGSSGGPLADVDGRVIGINALISGRDRGLCFAIPINEARSIAKQLIAHGRVIRPWLGIKIQSLSDDPAILSAFPEMTAGVLIRTICPQTPASESGLRAGDVILAVDNQAVRLAAEVQKRVLSHGVGDPLQLRVWSRGRIKHVSLKPVEQPEKASPLPTPVLPRLMLQPTPEGVGLQIQALTDTLIRTLGVTASTGVVVTYVEAASAAAASGIRVGDVIQEVDSISVNSEEDFLQALRASNLRTGVIASIDRRGERTIAILKQ